MDTKDIITKEALERALLLTLTDIKKQDDTLQKQIDTLLSGKANNTLSNFVDNKDASNITTTDTIASALSKVENQIKNKANDGSEITLTGYEKGTDKTDIVETDTLNSAIGKIENKLDDKLDISDTYTFICTL